MMAIGFLVACQFYIRRPDIPKSLAAQHDVLYRFLLNKWYFDEIYDFLFVRPALWLGRLLWKGGDGAVIDGLGPDGVSARVLDVTRNVVRLQTGYLYHYAFAMLIGDRGADHLVHVRGEPLMSSWPILSITTFLPVLGVLFILTLNGDDDDGEAQRALGRAVDHARHLRGVADAGVALRSGLAGIPVRREAALARRHHRLSHGRRRHLAAVRDPHHRA